MVAIVNSPETAVDATAMHSARPNALSSGFICSDCPRLAANPSAKYVLAKTL